jgi:hypothetical protein
MLGAMWRPVRGEVCRSACATFLTFLLVQVIEAIFVLDLKLVTWDKPAQNRTADSRAESASFAALWPNASPAARLDSDCQM